MTIDLTDTTLAAFLRRVEHWRPTERDDAEAALSRLIDWTRRQSPALLPLPAKDQDTVAFGLGEERGF